MPSGKINAMLRLFSEVSSLFGSFLSIDLPVEFCVNSCVLNFRYFALGFFIQWKRIANCKTVIVQAHKTSMLKCFRTISQSWNTWGDKGSAFFKKQGEGVVPYKNQYYFKFAPL